jgi:alpha-tubulin suppressor-like RCC1 family protein
VRARPFSLALAVAAAFAAGGCGETLVDHTGVSILQSAATCGAGQIVCNGECVTQSVALCGGCNTACPAAPAHAAEVCTLTGVGGHGGSCDFTCDAGLLRCGDACCAPGLVATGATFSCATTATGTEVHCFGAGNVGQLGDGGAASRSTSALVGHFATPVTALSAGGNHACAISGATTYCWGDGAAFGASGSVLSPQAVPALAGASAISASPTHTCAVVGASAVCVGQVPGAGGGSPALGGAALAVAAGSQFSCALVSTGTGSAAVKCWGDDTYGQLGDATSGSASPTAVQVGAGLIASSVTHLAAGTHHACAGTPAPSAGAALWCWGDNSFNQLGTATGALLGPTLNSRVKKGILALAGADRSSCATESDVGGGGDVLSCWGNDSALLATTTGEPIQLQAATTAYAFAAGGSHLCFVNTLVSPARLQCLGANGAGQLGNGTTTGSLSAVSVIDR